jgi:hypothetical protein
MRTCCAWSRVFLGVLLVGVVVTGCSQPPPPSAETAALESSLMSVDDIGGGFVEEYRGDVGMSGWGVCPETDFKFEDTGMVRASFYRPVGDDDQIEVVEMMYVVESDVDQLMADLTAAYESCYGLVWTDYGEKKTVEAMTAPVIGDDSLAVAFPPGEVPSRGTYDYGRTIYVTSGDVFIEISCWETIQAESDTPLTSNDELYRIAATAVTNLEN